MIRNAPIVIKRGCWIGQNVVILPGVTIGELSIIGANSVVTRDVPARSIAVGAPARVIKSWDATARRWVAVSAGT
jgi:acetyltransferase-like isoleucine patch superfamily enzyme